MRSISSHWRAVMARVGAAMAGALWLGLAVEARGLVDADRLGRQVDATG